MLGYGQRADTLIINPPFTSLTPMRNRTFGWVQNPSSFDSLKRVVALFIHDSTQHQYLITMLRNRSVITDKALCEHFLTVLTQPVISPTYADLVGTGRSNRKTAPCDALAQASITPQKKGKQYVDNWSADGFVRWAECLGFIDYIENEDRFVLTERGRQFALDAQEDFSSNEALIEGLLSYPPVERVLALLDEHDEHTGEPVIRSKFQMGAQLGFTGEAGFTSISHALVVRQLTVESDEAWINKIRLDIEGSSDKYARMISGWLCSMGWLTRKHLSIYNTSLNKTIQLGHCFSITTQGIHALRQLTGRSRHKAAIKRVSWYSLATNARNKNYLRTRRLALLMYLRAKRSRTTPLSAIGEALREQGFIHGDEVFAKDIKGLHCSGLTIEQHHEGGEKHYRLTAHVPLLTVPAATYAPLNDAQLEQEKEQLLSQLHHLDPDWVELIEISRDGKQNALFEAKVTELLSTHYGLEAIHLGGPSKPDCVGFFQGAQDAFGIVVDMKAYKEGFPFSASEKDKMVRYMTDNQRRSAALNPTQWWTHFPSELDLFYFLFVSSSFTHTAPTHLNYISQATDTQGAALDVKQLLLGAEAYERACASDPQLRLKRSGLHGAFNNQCIVAPLLVDTHLMAN